ncbi:hypothetical protein [Brachybacterium endophyticum]|uniref:hypothetical protein n=1 Tax=Brachybacterium endophyticum TaxID=2182385 RepID=UPI001058252D|nr:hypothetical protein [Brachybacterium endophyticum]
MREASRLGAALDWLALGGSRLRLAATVSMGWTALAGTASAILGPLDGPVWLRITVPLTSVASALTAWILKNADRHRVQHVAENDTEMLIRSLGKILKGVGAASRSDPHSIVATEYVQHVASELRERLEPKGLDDMVRVCVYKRDQANTKEPSDGPLTEEPLASATTFNLYACDMGGREDPPRPTFVDNEAPGSKFMPELFSRGRYVAKERSDFIHETRYETGEPPAYGSFVNWALFDKDLECQAMVTCDSRDEYYFDKRRERLIRTYAVLMNLALEGVAQTSSVDEPSTLAKESRKGSSDD